MLVIYQTKSSIENDEIKSKLDESEIKLLTDLFTETELWMEQDHSKDDYDNKLTEINGKINPIMMKIYSEGGREMPEAVPVSSDNDKSTIDEID